MIIYLVARPVAPPWNVGSMRSGRIVFYLTLSLLVVRVFGADHHDLTVSFDDLAFVAHRLYGSTYFHKNYLLE